MGKHIKNFDGVGVYAISSKSLAQILYIGSSINLRDRLHSHRASLKAGYHNNKKLQGHYNNYGSDDLIFKVLEYCEQSLLNNKEWFYILELSPTCNHNNIYGQTFGLNNKASNIARIDINKDKHLSNWVDKEEVLLICNRELFPEEIIPLDIFNN